MEVDAVPLTTVDDDVGSDLSGDCDGVEEHDATVIANTTANTHGRTTTETYRPAKGR